jgi:peptide/nickel transport system substrate-binding protein
VTLDPNPFAPRAPHLHEIEIRIVGSFDAALSAFSAGQVDAVEATTPAQRSMLAQIPGAHVHDSVSFRFVDMLFNAHRPGLDDPAVRRAIASAVDRHALIAAALQGDARIQVDAIPVGVSWLGSGSGELPDPILAQRALDAAGWRVAIPDRVRSKNGAPLAFALSVPDAEPLPAVAHVLATQLEAIGVEATVRPVAPASFAGDVLGKLGFDLAVADWDNGPDPDVSSFWRSNATPPAGFNVSGLPPDPFLDQALDGLATERDQQVRQDAAHRVNQRLTDDAPAAFLYAPQVSFVVNGSIQGVHVPAGGTSGSRYEGFTDWSR